MGYLKAKVYVVAFIALVFFTLFLVGGAEALAQPRRGGAPPPQPQQPSPAEKGVGDLSTTWKEFKEEAKNWLPNQIEDAKEWLQSLRVVKRPEQVIKGYEQNPRLWKTITAFYDFIKGKELNVYQEQRGIPGFFPNRSAYYDFLDTILPPMRARRFERHRVLTYTVHSIEHCRKDPSDPESGKDPGKVKVRITITSDDTYPFGKVMTYTQLFHLSKQGWYPGKVEAAPATLWEKIR